MEWVNPLTVGPYSTAYYDPTTSLLYVTGLNGGTHLYVNSPPAGDEFTLASDGNGGTLVGIAANTQLPAPTTPSGFALVQGSVSTQSNTIAIVNTPTITGKGGISGETITLYDGSTVVGTGTTFFVGVWNVTCQPLSEGLHTLTATQTNPSTGVTSAGSATFTFLVDTKAPVVSIAGAAGTTSQQAQTISGTIDIADAGSTVLVYDGTTQISAVMSDPSGQWSTTISLVKLGANAITAQASDVAGNSGTSNALTYNLLAGEHSAHAERGDGERELQGRSGRDRPV